MPEATRGELVVHAPTRFDEAHLAAAGFLAGYTGRTREAYTVDLRRWGAFCETNGLAVLAARRPHIELFARQMEAENFAPATVARRLSTLASYYRYCEVEGVIERSPAAYVRRPKVDMESTTLGLDRMELGAFITHAGVAGATAHALACLLGLNGLRVSEACGIDIADLATERGHRTVSVTGKGNKTAVMPLAPRTARAVDLAAGERLEGPLLIGVDGERLDRFAAGRIVRRVAKRAGITKNIGPHSLRHSFITAALDAGVPLRDVQIAARHSDPRTTTRYDRARNNLDRHAAYVVCAFVAGAA